MVNNTDCQIMQKCISKERLKIFGKPTDFEYPLDNETVDRIKVLCGKISSDYDDFAIFKHRKEIIDPLWKMLIEKSIKSLRYFDAREPFKNSNRKKTPKAYGIDELKTYYDQYAEFENILYGSNRYYRDHVVHVFRTWLSGVELLTRNKGEYLKIISLHEKECTIKLNPIEILSIWTLVALTHDLGYPLQKAKNIIDTTRSMVSTFITNPDISIDFSFHGVQNYMNDFIVRLMSSKMRKDKIKTSRYVARLQPKYYFKFQKSLEKNSHGILSTLIIYKLLTYFLESDYSINEDYTFDKNECRQFYIRREILRAIASHTCNDVYQLYMASFSFLLRICDDTQQWGRKNISELYVKTSQKYEPGNIDLSIDQQKDLKKRTHKCTIKEKISLPGEPESVIKLIERLRKQSLAYITIFRDGQDTISRDFSFERILLIECDEKIEFTLTLKIPKDGASELIGKITYTSDDSVNERFGEDFFNKIYESDPVNNWRIMNSGRKEVDKSKLSNWRECEGVFPILLSK